MVGGGDEAEGTERRGELQLHGGAGFCLGFADWAPQRAELSAGKEVSSELS